MESMYVTDQSRWGKLIFDRAEIDGSYSSTKETAELASFIESYHRHWLDQNDSELGQLLDENVMRFRQGNVAYGITDVTSQISQESRGERPKGFKSSMQFKIHDVRIRAHGDFASALYRIAIHGGARWEYADLTTILQVFRKLGGRGNLLDTQKASSLMLPPHRRWQIMYQTGEHRLASILFIQSKISKEPSIFTLRF